MLLLLILGVITTAPEPLTHHPRSKRRELKEEKRTEVLGTAGERSFTAGKEMRVIEDEATVRRLMVNFDSSKIGLVLTCMGKDGGRIFQDLNSMELVGVLTPEDDGGQLSIFWPPQALRLVQYGWDGEEARRRRRCCCCCLAYKYE